MSIRELIANLIGMPERFEIVDVQTVDGSVQEIVKILDLEYIVSAILLLMTVFVIYNLLLYVVKYIGGIRHD